MKRLTLSIALFTTCVLTLSAARSSQSDGKNLNVTATEVIRTDNTVNVTFMLDAGDEVAAKKRSLILRPVLQGNGGQTELPPIIIRGKRASVDNENVAMAAAGVDNNVRYLVGNGKTLEYQASLPWQSWMSGSQLVLNGINAGKGKVTEVNVGMVADNLLTGGVIAAPVPNVLATPSIQAVQSSVNREVSTAQAATAPRNQTAPVAITASVNQPAQPVPAADYGPRDRGMVVQRSMPSLVSANDYSPTRGYYERPMQEQSYGTIGDELSARFTFVEPVARYQNAYQVSNFDPVFDYNMPLILGTGVAQQQNDVDKFIEMTREGALYIKFDRGSYMVGRDLGENNRMLVDLISSIRVINANPETRVAQVIIVGFSSPEGSNDEKQTLAMERAGVVRDFITANSSVDPGVISIYNGSVDWTSLRALVSESNMPEKYKILDIIDNVPAWDTSRNKGRLGQLMALNGGETFRYMREHFFPQLRQTGAYVKIYYENVK